LPEGGRIASVRQMAEGFSNETYLVDGLDLILRLPPTGPGLLTPNRVHDVVTQFRIMAEYAARPSAPPVPRPVLLETDPAILGAPFFLMERVPCDPWGDWQRPDWVKQGGDALRSRISDQIVGLYARLHGLAPLEALGRPLTLQDELERWQAPVRDIANPILREAFALLFATAPQEQAPVPCHGDAKIANMLWRDGRIVAMVDYEMSFNGDPRWDVAALLQNLKNKANGPLGAKDEDGFWGRDHILADWQARTGRSAARLGWFEAAARARYAAILTYGQYLSDRGESDDPRFAQFGPTAERLSRTALELARRDS
jgi:aminoglycoside phosphotransferase (APT) family kinase protein